MNDDDAKPFAGSATLQTDALFAQVYDRLKAMAGRGLAGRPRDTLDTTALVHELYLRIGDIEFAHSDQFFTYAARAMRHLLIDRARARLRLHAGGDWVRTTLSGSDTNFAIDSAEQALALDEALQRLEGVDARAARVVELICFAGLNHEQTAAALGLALRTVARDWRFSRAFLRDALGG